LNKIKISEENFLIAQRGEGTWIKFQTNENIQDLLKYAATTTPGSKKLSLNKNFWKYLTKN